MEQIGPLQPQLLHSPGAPPAGLLASFPGNWSRSLLSGVQTFYLEKGVPSGFHISLLNFGVLLAILDVPKMALRVPESKF